MTDDGTAIVRAARCSFLHLGEGRGP